MWNNNKAGSNQITSLTLLKTLRACVEKIESVDYTHTRAAGALCSHWERGKEREGGGGSNLARELSKQFDYVVYAIAAAAVSAATAPCLRPPAPLFTGIRG